MTRPRGASRPAVLLCAPRHYVIRYEINPWMRLGRQPAAGRAARQWEALRRLLVRCGARVRLIPPRSGLPDMCFTANAGLVHGRTFIPARFRHPQRRGEEAAAAAWFRARGYRVAALPRRFAFEGEGDALRQGATWLFGFRFRSEEPAHAPLALLLRARVLPLELRDPRFYHLDTCFAPLDDRTALWFPRAFDRYGRRVIGAVVPDPVAVSAADALRFACNALPAGRSVILHRGISRALRRALERRGFVPRETDLSEFLKAGGAAKCLALRL